MRSALRGAAAHGYYVFENLMTEQAGIIDFLAVGPVGACVIVVRDDEGTVTAAEDGVLYLNGERFDDDPNDQVGELQADVQARIQALGAEAYGIVCFTRPNELYYLGDDLDVLRGISTIWNLAQAFEEAEEAHTAADVAEIADAVRRAYDRPPFVTPEGGAY